MKATKLPGSSSKATDYLSLSFRAVKISFCRLPREFQGLLQPSGSALRIAVVKDSHQFPPALPGSHSKPSFVSDCVSCECGLNERRQFFLCFHGLEQAFGNLLGATTPAG